MRKFLLLSAVAALLVAGLSGCRKENGIDNNQVIQRPYSLYFSDMDGALYNTNTGDSFNIVFAPDGAPDRAISTTGNSILWVKNGVFLSQNNGGAFNPCYGFPQERAIANWQPMILNVPDHGRVYIAGQGLFGADIAYSEDNGKNWIPDTLWVPADRPTGAFISSFAQLANGVLFVHDYTNAKFYVRSSKAARWALVKSAGLTPGKFFLSHIDNTLIVVDGDGAEGASYSTDNGVSWTKYTGLPTDVKLLCANAPFDQTVLVGTEGKGIYRLENGVFQPSSSGLDGNTSVRGIVGKNNIYKNGRDLRYIYITTSTGLYVSGDQGFNWIKVKPGRYNSIY